MVYANYSDLVSNDSQGFGLKYVDLILGYTDARAHSKYMPITEMYSKDDGRSIPFTASSSCFMYSAKFLEGSQDGNNEQVLKEKMEQIKKKKQKQKGSSKKKIVSSNSDLTSLPK